MAGRLLAPHPVRGPGDPGWDRRRQRHSGGCGGEQSLRQRTATKKTSSPLRRRSFRMETRISITETRAGSGERGGGEHTNPTTDVTYHFVRGAAYCAEQGASLPRPRLPPPGRGPARGSGGTKARPRPSSPAAAPASLPPLPPCSEDAFVQAEGVNFTKGSSLPDTRRGTRPTGRPRRRTTGAFRGGPTARRRATTSPHASGRRFGLCTTSRSGR